MKFIKALFLSSLLVILLLNPSFSTTKFNPIDLSAKAKVAKSKVAHPIRTLRSLKNTTNRNAKRKYNEIKNGKKPVYKEIVNPYADNKSNGEICFNRLCSKPELRQFKREFSRDIESTNTRSDFVLGIQKFIRERDRFCFENAFDQPSVEEREQSERDLLFNSFVGKLKDFDIFKLHHVETNLDEIRVAIDKFMARCDE